MDLIIQFSGISCCIIINQIYFDTNIAVQLYTFGKINTIIPGYVAFQASRKKSRIKRVHLLSEICIMFKNGAYLHI